MNKNMWDRIEQARAEWNVLEHPFYQRWSAGELTREELADYSGQYRYATEAIARMSPISPRRPAGERAGLEAHAGEEASHVAMWDGFVRRSAAPSVPAERRDPRMRRGLDQADGFGNQLARMYAVESGQPAISKTKPKASPPTTTSTTAG